MLPSLYRVGFCEWAHKTRNFTQSMHSVKPADLMLCAEYPIYNLILGSCTKQQKAAPRRRTCLPLDPMGYCRFVALLIFPLLPTVTGRFQALKTQGRSSSHAPLDASITISAVRHQKSPLPLFLHSPKVTIAEYLVQVSNWRNPPVPGEKITVLDLWLWQAKCQHLWKDIYHCGTEWEHVININNIPPLPKSMELSHTGLPLRLLVTEVQIQPGSELTTPQVGEEPKFISLIAYCTLHLVFLASSSY